MTRAHKIVTSVVMPAGEYWVGDPCYSVPDERWMEWLNAAEYLDNSTILLAELDGKPVLGISTAYGDGEYHDHHGNSYPVDAGLIGLTPVELVTDEPFGSHRVIFANAFTCHYEDGVITLGHFTIDTNGYDEGKDD